jgi:hypothetical protein
VLVPLLYILLPCSLGLKPLNAEQEQVDMGSSYEEEYGVYTEYEGSVESSETEEEYYSE